MNIQDAFKMSGINGKIARARELSTDPSFYLMPTNWQKRILMYSDGEQMPIKWEPKFDDLVADDWVVIGQGTVPHYFDDSDDKTLMNIQKAVNHSRLKSEVVDTINQKQNLVIMIMSIHVTKLLLNLGKVKERKMIMQCMQCPMIYQIKIVQFRIY